MSDLEAYKLSDEIQQIGNYAVQKAQAENHAKGLPNVYSKNGVIYWQLPDGTITQEDPFEPMLLDAKSVADHKTKGEIL